MTKAVLAATAAVTLAACATTSLQSTWKNPAAAPLNLKGKKVVALVVIDEEALRSAAEDEAAREITAHGGVGVPAHTLLPQAQIRDKERARAIFEREGIEAVVVVRPVAKEKALSGSFVGSPGYSPFWGPGFWGGGFGADGYLRTDTILIVETLVYSLQQNKLVWASQSQTMNPTQVGSFARTGQDARHGDGEAGPAVKDPSIRFQAEPRTREKGNMTMRPALIGLFVLATGPLTLAQEPAAAPPPPSVSRYLGLHAYPAKAQIAAQQQKLYGFKKAYGACMEAKSYVVK